MKKHLIFALCSLLCLQCFAQEAPLWNKQFDGKIKWYKLSDAGIVIVCSGDALYGIKPEDGSEIWKLPQFDDIREENFAPIEGSPFVAIVWGGMMGRKHAIINSQDGKIVASSKQLGFTTVNKRIECRKLGSLLLYGLNGNGKPMLTMVSFNDGTKIWEQTKLFERNSEQIVSDAYVVNDGLLIATNRNIYKLNPATGEIIWSVDMKSDLPMAPPPSGAFAAFGSKGATEAATAVSADFFQYGDSSKVYFWNQDNLTAFNIADGKEVWKRAELKSPVGLILYDSRGMLVATAEKTQEDIARASKGGGGLFGKITKGSASGKNRASLFCYDYATGVPKWSEDIDLQGDIVAYKMNGSKLILATERDKGSNYITIADLDAGKSVTKRALKIDGKAADLQIVPQGLYYRSDNELNILNLDNGDKTWKKGFKVKNNTGCNESDKAGYVYANNTIYKVDFTTGDMNEWVKNISFEGKEEPENLEVRDNGVLVTSSQNMTLYDRNGNTVWHAYQQPPGRTTGGKILSGFAGTVAAAASVASAASAAQLSYAKGYYGSTSVSVDNEIKNRNQMAGAWGNMAVASFASINKRFKASRQANDYMSMLTNFGNNNSKDNVGIIAVSKITGQPGKKIILADKEPDYKLDEIDRMVYFKSDDHVLKGYKF